MTSAAIQGMLRAPGRLSINPTDLSAAYPHGGTELGAAKGLQVVRLADRPYPVIAEEYGGEPVEQIQSAETWAVGAFLRGWSSDAVETIFPNTTTGAVSGHAVIESPGANRAGHKESARSVVLLWTPDNVRDVPAVLLYRAVPMTEAQTQFDLSRSEEMGMPVLFEGLRDTSARTIAWGRLADLTL